MIYKVMSTVNAHLDNENNIVSPTQTLLQNRVLQTSKYMPESIRERIIDANVVVDHKSIRDNNVCKGDIYIETKGDLTLIEQRKMMDAMTRISRSCGESVMTPVIFRESPNKMPMPALPDKEYNPSSFDGDYKETESAFIGMHAVVSFDGTDVKSTFLKSADTLSALNKELNSNGLVAVFADSSVCRQVEPIKRDCFMILQKTSRYKENEHTISDLCASVETALKSTRLNVAAIDTVEHVSVAGQYGLLGTVSMENVQMASKRVIEQTNNIQNTNDSILAFVAMEQNPWFMNGIGGAGVQAVKDVMKQTSVPRGPRLTRPLFCNLVPSTNSDVFTSSTEQDLAKDWHRTSTIQLNLSSDNEDVLKSLYEKLDDIVNDMNESFGCDEDEPVVAPMSLGKRIRVGATLLQPLFIKTYPNVMSISDESVRDTFISTIEDYVELRDCKVSSKITPALVADIKDAKSAKAKSVSVVKLPQVSTELKSGMLQTDLANTKETQMTM